MPSGEHDTPIELAKLDPGFLAWLLVHVFDVEPEYHHARPTDVRVVVSRTYHVDGMPFRPFIFTPGEVPLVVDVELAQASPALAVFSALCHGDDAGVDAAFPALAQALRVLGPSRAIFYYDIVLAGLPPDPRARWEAFMSTGTNYEFRRELFREIAARGRAAGEAQRKARGKAQGEAQAVLTVLDARGVPVSEAIREQILACTDLAQLDTWLRRVATAATADEVIHP